MTKNLQKNKGFVMLFAVTLSAIILSIALGIAGISLKEIKFSTSAKNTNEAFFAADAGVECALFYEMNSNAFPLEGPAPDNISCTSNTSDTSEVTFDTGSYNFVINNLGSSGQNCVAVTIFKEEDLLNGSIKTTITSKGYNFGGESDCLSSNPNRVERELRVTL